MTSDELIASVRAAQQAYLDEGYSPGWAARMTAVAEAERAYFRHAWSEAHTHVMSEFVEREFVDLIDKNCGIVRSEN